MLIEESHPSDERPLSSLSPEEVRVSQEVDARGKEYPLPLLELITVVRRAAIGQVVAVVVDDEGSKQDVPWWIQIASHQFLGAEPYAGAVRLLCRKMH